MKSRVLSLILVMCMVMSLAAFSVSAASITVHTTCLDGVVAKYSSGFGHANMGDDPLPAESNGLGGKALGDAYAKVDTTGRTDPHFITVDGKDKVRASTYYVMTLNIYGNATYFNTYDRISGSIKPYFTKVNAADFKANTWNNVTYVYTVATKSVDTYVNGELKGTVDMTEATTAISATTIYNYITQLRSQVANNKTFYIDDVMTYSTDTVPANYMPVIKNEDITIYENSSTILFTGDSFEVDSDDTVRVSKDDGATWTENNTAQSGDKIALERTSDNGKTYKVYTVYNAKEFKSVLATKDSGVSYIQGGNPMDADGNIIANTKVDVENPHGSGLTMEMMAVGVNNSNSTQTYYQYNWPVANRTTDTRYLVVEANFAIPTKTATLYPAGSMGLSTNGGDTIGSIIGFNHIDRQNRINHYMWVYDKVNGTYMDYLNGEPMVDEPVAVLEAFKTGGDEGKTTAVRFAANGAYIKDADETTRTRLYAAYLSDYEIYECYEYEVPQGLRIPGSEYSSLPVTSATLTAGDLFNLFSEEDRQYVTLYANRGYSPVTDSEKVLNSGSAIVMTCKDGIYDYARVCYAPSEDADYFLDTIQAPTDNSVYVVVVNTKDTGSDKRKITFVLARYDKTTKQMLDVNFTSPEMAHKGTVGISLPAATSMEDVYFYALDGDGFTTMKPVNYAMKLR